MGGLSWMLVDSHKRDCGTPTVKRLYIRDSINAKQKFVPCGVICCCCGVIKIRSEMDYKK